MFEIINRILWAVATALILYVGIYYTIKLKFVQINFKEIFNALKNKNKNKISPLKILSMTLGGRIGVGSLAGIALAINIGGIGTVFWIWIFSILTSPNAFVEGALGVIYKEKDKDHYKGGPSFYIDKGLKKKGLAKTYSILILVAYTLGFLTIQSNTIAILLMEYVDITKIMVGIFLSLITIIAIFKGLETITSATIKIVPLMGLIYLLTGITVLVNNISALPGLLSSIIKEALNFESLKTGAVTAMIIGLQRGIFSNESGLGTGAIASGAAEDNNAKGQGYIQVLGVYFTSLIICTTTALIIITSDYSILNLKDINGIELTQYALNFHLGKLGDIILSITIFLFAFSTIITIYYYGESSLKYLFPNIKDKHLIALKVIIAILVIYGSIAKASFLWKIIDIFVALLAIINVYSIFKLRIELKNKLVK